MSSLNEILVSLVIPVYNVEKYLQRCVDSVCHQSHKNLEIILVDDGSPDACPQICDEYAKRDNRVVVIHQSNRGLYAARNAGIDIANGEWLCFIDSDDYIDPHFVEILLEAAVKNNCLTARCKRKFTYLDTIDEKQPERETKVCNWFEYAVYIDNTPGYTLYSVCWSIYHKSLFKELRFPPYRHTEDAPVNTQVLWLAREKNFAISNQTLYYYYQSPSSIIRGSTNLNVLNRYEAFDWIFDFWSGKGEPEIVDLYFRMYFTSLVIDYTILCRDLPEKKSMYTHLYNLIEHNAEKARFMNLKVAVVPSISKNIWENILIEGRRFILYGFGDRGREILPWLIYFGISVEEVWDQNADKYEVSYGIGIPLINPHANLDRKDDYTVIIAIDDERTAFLIRRRLRQMGYNNFISCNNIFGAIKYAKYKKLLPFFTY